MIELPRDVAINAARQDVESAARLLAHAANAVKDCACIPRSAHIAYAQIILTLRADGGDERAARKLREYEQAATDYEGARVALADLTIDG